MTFSNRINRFNQLHLCAMAGLLISSLSFTANAQAQWQLVSESSQLHFISTKATHIAESHTFTKLQGNVSDAGQATLTIDLASVETMIPIRNERMGTMLFEIAAFPIAKFTAQIDLEAFNKLNVGAMKDMALDGQLSLRSSTLQLKANLRVIKLDGNRVEVQTLKPIILNANSLSIIEGIEKLRNIAGLPSISHSVPVTFSLVFQQ
jgi:polyisoprenoid-binding protein YceI